MKQVPSNIRDPVSEQFNRPEFYRNQFHRYKGVAGEKPVVGKVLLSANDDSFLVVKTLVRHVRYDLRSYSCARPQRYSSLRTCGCSTGGHESQSVRRAPVLLCYVEYSFVCLLYTSDAADE